MQFDRESLHRLFDLADLVRPIAQRESICTVLDGAVLGSLFFEPSTRTRLSFESAFLRLGELRVTTTTGFTFSSMAKGESIADTSRVVSGYSDALVVRHPDEGSVAEFAAASVVPVINAGDGAGEHPSQALLDFYTLRSELERRDKAVDGCTIAIVGDLKYGRTVHSLMKLLSLAEGVTFRMFSPPSLELPPEIARYARARGHRVFDTDSVPDALTGADVVYATRVQRERMTEEVLANANVSGNLMNRQILARPGPRRSSSCTVASRLPAGLLRPQQRRRPTARPVHLPADRQRRPDPNGDLPHRARLLPGRGQGDHQAAALGRHPALALVGQYVRQVVGRRPLHLLQQAALGVPLGSEAKQLGGMPEP